MIVDSCLEREVLAYMVKEWGLDTIVSSYPWICLLLPWDFSLLPFCLPTVVAGRWRLTLFEKNLFINFKELKLSRNKCSSWGISSGFAQSHKGGNFLPHPTGSCGHNYERTAETRGKPQEAHGLPHRVVTSSWQSWVEGVVVRKEINKLYFRA